MRVIVVHGPLMGAFRNTPKPLCPNFLPETIAGARLIYIFFLTSICKCEVVYSLVSHAIQKLKTTCY